MTQRPISYNVVITRSAEKEITDLPKAIRARARVRLLALRDNPRPSGVRKLKDSNAYRIRLGDYRVVYTIDDALKVVTIFRVRHRSDVYRDL